MKLTESQLRNIIREEVQKLKTENVSRQTIQSVASSIEEVLNDVMGRGYNISTYEEDPQIFVGFEQSDYSLEVSVSERKDGITVEFGGEALAERKRVSAKNASELGLRNRDFAVAVETSMQETMEGPRREKTYRQKGPGPY